MTQEILMPRLTSLIFVAALFAGCSGNHSPTADPFCPCAPGFSCDTTTNMCVVPAAVDASCTATCSTPAGTVQPLTSIDEIYAALAGTWQICTDLADWNSIGAPSDVIGIEFGPASTTSTSTAPRGTGGGDAYYLVQPEASSGPVRGNGFAYQLTYSVWQEGAQSFQFNIFPSSNSLVAGGLRYSPCPTEIELDLDAEGFSSVLVHF
jgi:hypothetical protein